MSQGNNKNKDKEIKRDLKKGLEAVDQNREKPYNTPIEKKNWVPRGLFDFSKPTKKKKRR